VALAEKLARYGDSRSATLLDWEPGSRAMLIGTRFGDVPQIHRVAMPGGARTQLTFFADRTAGGGDFTSLRRAVCTSSVARTCIVSASIRPPHGHDRQRSRVARQPV